MARLALDTKNTSIFTASKEHEATPIFEFVDKKLTDIQSVDKATGLPLWSLEAELIEGEESTLNQKIKIASATKPELKPRTEYFIDGDMYATPYIQEKNNRAFVAISLTLVGGFKTSRSAGLPEIHKN